MSDADQQFTSVRYETVRPKVARITLARPEARNAQDTTLLYELNDAFDVAARDDDVSVIILAADGPHFSSGHDLRERNALDTMLRHDTVGTWCGFGCAGAEAQMAREKELYLGLCERWRNIPKPTIVWKLRNVTSTGGQYSRGILSNPITSASGSL